MMRNEIVKRRLNQTDNPPSRKMKRGDTQDAFQMLMGRKRIRRDENTDTTEDVVVIDDDVERAHERPPNRAGHGQATAAIFGGAGGGAVKQLICIRHGATEGYHLVDTPLSSSGREAARLLLRRVPGLDAVECVVTSPLTRAMHTTVLGLHSATTADGNTTFVLYRGSSAVSAGADITSAGASSSRGPGSSATLGPTVRQLPVYVTPLAAERTATVGDIGRPGSVLSAVPDLVPLQDVIARDVPEGHWWRLGATRAGVSAGAASTAATATPTRTVTGAGQAAVGSSGSPSSMSWTTGPAPASFRFPPGEGPEPVAAFRARVAKLRDFLRALPYTKIALIAHAETIRELTQSKDRLDYCGAAKHALRM